MSVYEAILKELGSFGPYQRRVFVLVSMFETPAAWAMLLPLLLNITPLWTCTSYEDKILIMKNDSYTYNQTENQTSVLIQNDSKLNYNTCEAVDSGLCQEVQFVDDFTSIISEWSLICGRKSIASLITTIQFCGVLFGALVAGQLADLFGRRKVLFGAYFLLIVFSLVSAFIPFWELFAVIRCIVGGLVGGVMVVNFVLPLEFVTPSWRTFCGCIGFWAVGLMTLALWGYLVRDWRWLVIATSLSSIPMMFTWWFVPESPRWLLKMGRTEETEVLLISMAKYNSKPTPDINRLKEFIQNEEDLQMERKKYSYIDLFRTKAMTKNTLIVMFGWFVSSSVYYGLNLNVRNLAGDKYLNILISGVVEIPALIFVVGVNNKLGRRKTISLLMLVAGISCFSILFIDVAGKLVSLKTLVIILAMVGKSGISGGWAGVQVFSAETFSTIVRNIGVGACSMAARIGGIVAPQFVALGNDTKPLPFTVFGCLAFCFGILVMFLPETSGKPLPDGLIKRRHYKPDNLANGHVADPESVNLQEIS